MPAPNPAPAAAGTRDRQRSVEKNRPSENRRAASLSFGKNMRQQDGKVGAQTGKQAGRSKAGTTARAATDQQGDRANPRNRLAHQKARANNQSRSDQLEQRAREEAGKRLAQGLAIALTGGSGTGTVSTVAGFIGKKTAGTKAGKWVMWGSVLLTLIILIVVAAILFTVIAAASTYFCQETLVGYRIVCDV